MKPAKLGLKGELRDGLGLERDLEWVGGMGMEIRLEMGLNVCCCLVWVLVGEFLCCVGGCRVRKGGLFWLPLSMGFCLCQPYGSSLAGD